MAITTTGHDRLPTAQHGRALLRIRSEAGEILRARYVAAEYLLLLPIGAVVGLVWANTNPESYFRTVFALDFFVNEIAMVLFFGLVMKEVVEATAPGGILHPWRRAALPVLAAAGAAVGASASVRGAGAVVR